MLDKKIIAGTAVGAGTLGAAGAGTYATMNGKRIDSELVLTWSEFKKSNEYQVWKTHMGEKNTKESCEDIGGLWSADDNSSGSCIEPITINKPIKIEGEQISGITGSDDAGHRDSCLGKGGYMKKDKASTSNKANCKKVGTIIYPEIWFKWDEESLEKIEVNGEKKVEGSAIGKLFRGTEIGTENIPVFRKLDENRNMLFFKKEVFEEAEKEYVGFPNHFRNIAVEDLCSELSNKTSSSSIVNDTSSVRDQVFLYSKDGKGKERIWSCGEGKLVNFLWL